MFLARSALSRWPRVTVVSFVRAARRITPPSTKQQKARWPVRRWPRFARTVTSCCGSSRPTKILPNQAMNKQTPLRGQTPGRPRRAAARARRGDRLPQLLGLKCNVEEWLDRLSVLVVGVGSIGATVALSLARLQIGRLLLVDRARFKPASILTQPVGPG